MTKVKMLPWPDPKTYLRELRQKLKNSKKINLASSSPFNKNNKNYSNFTDYITQKIE